MYILAFNGSPRKNGNTATLLQRALDGAVSGGAQTELIHLHMLTMKGCQSCYSCKKRGGESYGRCVLQDDFRPVYAKMERADAVIVGSPIFFGSVTSETQMFIERLFPYLNYGNYSSNFPRHIRTGLIYTMGATEEMMELWSQQFKLNEGFFSLLLGPAETLISTDTFHVKDYSLIVADQLESQVDRKLKHQREVFPLDCEKAFQMGLRLACER